MALDGKEEMDNELIGQLVNKMPEYTQWGQPRPYHCPVILECHGPNDWRVSAYTVTDKKCFSSPVEALKSIFIWEDKQ